MRHSKGEVYIHLIWATWDRLPSITPAMRLRLLGYIREECRRLEAEPLALEAVSDHVHLLVKLPVTVAISDLVKQVKGSSSHFVNHMLKPGPLFKWQGAYAAYSVSRRDLPALRAYIANQEKHHASGSAVPWLEIDDEG